jgi:hypothetical protein
MRLLGLLLAIAVQSLPAAVNLDAIGPKVGETAADFELRDQHGAPRRLSTLAGPKGTMLVFFRSADW